MRPKRTPVQQWLASLSEKDWQAQIIAAVRRFYGDRALVHAERPAVTSKGWRTPIQGDAGYPDLTILLPATGTKPMRLLVLECKTERGKLTCEQQEWIVALAQVFALAHATASLIAAVVRPSDAETVWAWIKP